MCSLAWILSVLCYHAKTIGMKKTLLITGSLIILVFAGIGLFLTAGFVAVNMGWTNSQGIVDNSLTTQTNNDSEGKNSQYPAGTKFIWNQSSEWQTLKEAIAKDALLIKQVSTLTGISPRLLVTPLVVEQLRLFHSEREVYKDLFSPLKILGTQTQFSWGVLGFKEKTAKQVEDYLKDKNSPYYLGPRYEHLLDFSTSDINSERFDRLTNYKDRYWAYLYGALYLKQLTTGWQKSGYDISGRPEIITTLFNIGFENSKPNANPQIGGSEIDIGNQKISFGRLAYEFYYSTELTDQFPIK